MARAAMFTRSRTASSMGSTLLLLATLLCASSAGASSSARTSALRAHAALPARASAAMAGPLPATAAIVLAGGVGSRMKADRPKQLLDLLGKPVMMHSLELFLGMPSICTVVLVLDEQYRPMMAAHKAAHGERLQFADPGKERQDSVNNGLNFIAAGVELVCVHDSARPLVSVKNVLEVIADAAEHGAAVLAVPCKATIKESDDGQFVGKTLQRSKLWEIQTPQVVRTELLRAGFAKAAAEKLEVTDDASLVEALGKPVKLTLGEYTNFKLTTPEDMVIARNLLERGLISLS
ncbi:2-C-methyl-D-erythritol 4-phosphate cytidylyltransferase-domain-containing protein, partial [Pavlovales sp. CCMP2436]